RLEFGRTEEEAAGRKSHYQSTRCRQAAALSRRTLPGVRGWRPQCRGHGRYGTPACRAQFRAVNRTRLVSLWLSLLALLVASLVLAVTFGPAEIAPLEVWQAIAHRLGLAAESPLNRLRDAIIWELRLPRVLTAASV